MRIFKMRTGFQTLRVKYGWKANWQVKFSEIPIFKGKSIKLLYMYIRDLCFMGLQIDFKLRLGKFTIKCCLLFVLGYVQRVFHEDMTSSC